jgi:hypothetical protein
MVGVNFYLPVIYDRNLPCFVYLYSVTSARLRGVISGNCMCYTLTICPKRQAIDDRINRDLIAQAREQGFVFSDPFADADMWRGLETDDLENPAHRCDPDETNWLFCKAIEATLFFIYQQKRRAIAQRP